MYIIVYICYPVNYGSGQFKGQRPFVRVKVLAVVHQHELILFKPGLGRVLDKSTRIQEQVLEKMTSTSTSTSTGFSKVLEYKYKYF